jgi:hypothetical protein
MCPVSMAELGVRTRNQSCRTGRVSGARARRVGGMITVHFDSGAIGANDRNPDRASLSGQLPRPLQPPVRRRGDLLSSVPARSASRPRILSALRVPNLQRLAEDGVDLPR